MRTAIWMALLASGMAAAPAVADVRAGVDAWTRKDYAAAIVEWREPAARGDPDAQYNLGQAYKRGFGVPADPVQAEAFYRAAAAQGHVQAQSALALTLHAAGARADALPWFEKAARQGEPRALYVLGTALFNGDDVAKDWPRAYAYMSRAAAKGLGPAKTSLRQMELHIPPAERKQGAALARGLAAGETFTPPAPTNLRRAAPLAAPAPPRVDATGWRIQLGAYGSEAAAWTAWRALQAKVPALEGVGTPQVTRIGKLVRLRSFVLDDGAAARTLCGRVTATGAACFPVAP